MPAMASVVGSEEDMVWRICGVWDGGRILSYVSLRKTAASIKGVEEEECFDFGRGCEAWEEGREG